MRPKIINMDPADESLTGFASNVTGASWTLSATTAGDSLAHRVTIRNDSATDHSGKTAPLVGTDENGNAITETITLPGVSATVTSTKYFKTLATPITPSATIGADTMDVGWADEFVSRWFRCDPAAWSNGMHVQAVVTGTINYTIQSTADPVEPAILPDRPVPVWFDCTNPELVNETLSKNGDFNVVPTAMRAKANSYSSGAELKVTFLQG